MISLTRLPTLIVFGQVIFLLWSQVGDTLCKNDILQPQSRVPQADASSDPILFNGFEFATLRCVFNVMDAWDPTSFNFFRSAVVLQVTSKVTKSCPVFLMITCTSKLPFVLKKITYVAKIISFISMLSLSRTSSLFVGYVQLSKNCYNHCQSPLPREAN